MLYYYGPNILSNAFLPLQCDGPKWNGNDVYKGVKVAARPSSDHEWSDYVPDWSRVSDRITDVVIPAWANALPDFLGKLMDELSGSPGTLADEIWRAAKDSQMHPEIVKEAIVRVSSDLCSEEQAFLRRRKKFTKTALAAYLDLDEDQIDEADVPTIAMCGSGGGLRAMVAGTSSYYSAQKAGLFDVITYTAGVW